MDASELNNNRSFFIELDSCLSRKALNTIIKTNFRRNMQWNRHKRKRIDKIEFIDMELLFMGSLVYHGVTTAFNTTNSPITSPFASSTRKALSLLAFPPFVTLFCNSATLTSNSANQRSSPQFS